MPFNKVFLKTLTIHKIIKRDQWPYTEGIWLSYFFLAMNIHCVQLKLPLNILTFFHSQESMNIAKESFSTDLVSMTIKKKSTNIKKDSMAIKKKSTTIEN